jgi:hypothetical protein
MEMVRYYFGLKNSKFSTGELHARACFSIILEDWKEISFGVHPTKVFARYTDIWNPDDFVRCVKEVNEKVSYNLIEILTNLETSPGQLEEVVTDYGYEEVEGKLTNTSFDVEINLKDDFIPLAQLYSYKMILSLLRLFDKDCYIEINAQRYFYENRTNQYGISAGIMINNLMTVKNPTWKGIYVATGHTFASLKMIPEHVDLILNADYVNKLAKDINNRPYRIELSHSKIIMGLESIAGMEVSESSYRY